MARQNQRMLRVRHKVSKVERDMTEASYAHLKRSYEVIGEIGDDGNVVELNPSKPQPRSLGKSVAAGEPTIGGINPKEDDLLQEEASDESENQDSNETSANVQMTVEEGGNADGTVDAVDAEEVNEAVENNVAEETFQDTEQEKPAKKKTGLKPSSKSKK